MENPLNSEIELILVFFSCCVSECWRSNSDVVRDRPTAGGSTQVHGFACVRYGHAQLRFCRLTRILVPRTSFSWDRFSRALLFRLFVGRYSPPGLLEQDLAAGLGANPTPLEVHE